jgi:antitoxin component YwqK of YwqJK toxin-antitoxin module
MGQLSRVFIVSFLALIACSDPTQSTPPSFFIENTDPFLHKTDQGWVYKKKLFSGYMVEKEKDGRIVYQLPIIDGKENGVAKGWYNTGEKLLERLFINGKKEGFFKQWWPNGHLRYVFHYKNDNYDGTQWVYFPNETKREASNYQKGEKEGIQRVWDEKGELISNYTIKNKKLYGVISVNSCIPVSH